MNPLTKCLTDINVKIEKLRSDYRACYVERIKEAENNIDRLINVNKLLMERMEILEQKDTQIDAPERLKNLENLVNKNQMTQTDREEISKWLSLHEHKIEKLEKGGAAFQQGVLKQINEIIGLFVNGDSDNETDILKLQLRADDLETKINEDPRWYDLDLIIKNIQIRHAEQKEINQKLNLII